MGVVGDVHFFDEPTVTVVAHAAIVAFGVAYTTVDAQNHECANQGH